MSPEGPGPHSQYRVARTIAQGATAQATIYYICRAAPTLRMKSHTADAKGGCRSSFHSST